jgi:hypothetical protein
MTVYSSPATIPAFPAGYAPGPSDFDGWVQDNLGFLTGQVVFRAERHAAQSIAATTWTVIQYDTIQEDPYAGWDGTTGFMYWTAPFTGWYEINVTAQVSTSSISIAGGVFVTAALRYQTATLPTPAFPGGVTASFTVNMAGGSDYVQGQLYTSGASTLNATAGRYSAMEIIFLSQ